MAKLHFKEFLRTARLLPAGCLVCGLMFRPPPSANAAETGPMTIQQARQAAFAKNWDLLAAKADIDIGMAQQIAAKEIPNPTASISVGKMSIDSAHGSSTPAGNSFFTRSYDTVVAISQLVEIGGKRSARKASAQAGLEAARQRFSDARRLLELAVTRAYVNALTTQRAEQVLRDSSASLRHEASIAEARLKAGDISSSDKSQIEITAERLELDAKKAESDARAARIQLEVLLGEPKPEGSMTLADTLETLEPGEEPSLNGADHPAMERPDVRAAEAALRKSESDLRLQRALRVPDPTFSVQYEHEPPDQPNSLGVAVAIPIPLWNHNRSGVAAARAARDQAEANAARTAAEAFSEIRVARLDYDSTRSRRMDYVKSILPKSASIKESVTFAYEKGGATLLDLLTAQRNDNEVRLAAAQAAGDAAIARATLLAALNQQSSSSTK